MRILYLTNKPIFPLVDGGCKAMLRFLDCLLEGANEVDHICISTHKHPFDPEAYPEDLRERISVEHVRIATEVKPKQVIKHLFNRKSYNIARFDSPLLHEKIKHQLKQHDYTHVILDSLYTCSYIDSIRSVSRAQIIVRTHNVEHLIWKQLATNQKGSFRKWYMKRLAEDLKRFEIAALKKADLIFSITADDSDKFQKLGIKKPVHTIPVAIPIDERTAGYSKNSICFLGAMNWGPNIEAVKILRNSIFPKLRAQFPELKFHLAGSFMNERFPSSPEEGFINQGFVEDSNDFLRERGILVLPLLSGSGVKIKVLEAMALGIPIVTTSVGALGIVGKDALIIADKEDLMIEKIGELVRSEELRRSLGSEARNRILNNYSKAYIAGKIQHILNEQ
jgi:glycosyltransferase involved in cell wall biosynthesis